MISTYLIIAFIDQEILNLLNGLLFLSNEDVVGAALVGLATGAVVAAVVYQLEIIRRRRNANNNPSHPPA